MAFRLKILLCSVVCLLVVAGCGGSGGTVTTTSIKENQSLVAPQFPANSFLDRVQKSGRLRVGVLFNQPGFGQKTTAGAVPTGFDIEIARLFAQGIFGGLAKDQDQHIDYIESVSTNRETFLQTDRVDLVVAAYPITSARAAQVDFVGPYYVAHGDVLVKTASTIRNVSDLNGLAVCMKTGSSFVSALQSRAPQVNITQADTYSQCTQRLTADTVRAVVSDDVVIAGLAQASGSAFRSIGASFSDDPYGIGVKKGNTQLAEFLASRLRVIENTGDWNRAYAATLGTLGLPTPEPPVVQYPTTTTSTTSSTAPAVSSPGATSGNAVTPTTVVSGTTTPPK